MRWVWPTARLGRLSLRQQLLLPTFGASLWQTHRVGPLLQSSCQQSFAKQARHRTGTALLEPVPHHPKLHTIGNRTAVEDDKYPVNSAEHLEAGAHWKAKKIADTGYEGDALERAKYERPGTPSEHVISTEPRKTVAIVHAGEPAAPELGPQHEMIEERPAASDRTAGSGEPAIQLTGHGLAFCTYKPAQKPPATTPSDHPGFSIDVHGQLRIASRTAALRKSRTALIITSASRNLVEADFIRLLGHTPNLGIDQAGFIRAIPGRDTDFNRLSYWTLLFESPYKAASFQHRLRWYHANATLNLPVNPYTAATIKERELSPAEGYIDPLSGEDVWKRLHEFSVLLPTQGFNAIAMLEPFPETVRTDIMNYELWRFPCAKSECWPVRIWIDDYQLDAALVKRFLEDDGNERARKWALSRIKPVEPMLYTAFNSRGDPMDPEGNQMSKKNKALLQRSPQRNWVIRFSAEEAALLFWSTWHRRPLPQSLFKSLGEERLLHVDLLW